MITVLFLHSSFDILFKLKYCQLLTLRISNVLFSKPLSIKCMIPFCLNLTKYIKLCQGDPNLGGGGGLFVKFITPSSILSSF